MNFPLKLGRLEPTAPHAFRLKRRPEERVRVLGAEMDFVRPEEVMWCVTQAVTSRTKTIVANHNMHSLYLLRSDSNLKSFFKRAALIQVDSVPLIAWAHLTGHASRLFHRCTYLDWREDFWPLAAQQGWRVFYLGGVPGVVETAKAQLLERHPALQIDGRDGYFDCSDGAEANSAVLSQIIDFKPHVVFVGMGMPRQELWIEGNYDALPNCVIFSVGAAFDYEVGVQIPAPRWMGRAGIEWLFRLICNPRRLFTRYCIEPWFLLPAAMRDVKRALVAKFKFDRRPEGRKQNISAHTTGARDRRAQSDS